MAVILDELKKLEGQRKRGEIGDAEFRKLRQDIFDLIEDAQLAGLETSDDDISGGVDEDFIEVEYKDVTHVKKPVNPKRKMDGFKPETVTPRASEKGTEEPAEDPDSSDHIEDLERIETEEDVAARQTNEFLREGAMVLVAFALCLGFGTWIFGDPMFAFTVGLGMLAIFTIRAFQKIDEWD